MRLLIFLLSASACFGQLTMQHMQPFFNGSSLASRWWPTQANNGLVFWGELTPLDGTWDGALHPVGDNHRVLIWTNFAAAATTWTSDQALHPTNFISGGGNNSTSPHILFTGASSTRMIGASWPVTTNKSTWILVANCTATTGTDILVMNGAGGTPWFQYNAKKLEMSQGSTISSAATMTTSYFVITCVFAADGTSHIDTNGVAMVTGNAGTGNMAAPYLAQFNSVCYHGNLSRVWMWNGVLSAGDLTSAVAQCKTDFGIQ